jgi:hypothetical protein
MKYASSILAFDRIAADLAISPQDLDELVRSGAHAADELRSC